MQNARRGGDSRWEKINEDLGENIKWKGKREKIA